MADATVVEAKKHLPINTDITWLARVSAFAIRGRAISGLCPTLQKLYYPGFRLDQLDHKKSTSSKKRALDGEVKPKKKARHVPIWILKKYGYRPRPNHNAATNNTAAMTGCRLDDEVAAVVEWVSWGVTIDILGALVATTRLSTLVVVATAHFPSLGSKLAHDIHKWMPQTKALVAWLMRMRWVPIAAQFLVGVSSWRLATKVDLVCVDTATGQFVLVENKVGYAYRKVSTGGYLSAPFGSMLDTVEHQQHLQLLGTLILFVEGIAVPRYRIAMPVILRYEFGPTPNLIAEPLAAWALEQRSLVRKDFEERCSSSSSASSG